MTYDPHDPKNAEGEKLLRHIAETTDESIANVQRSIGTDIADLRAAAKRLEINDPEPEPIVWIDGDKVSINLRAAQAIADDLGMDLTSMRGHFSQLMNLLSQKDGSLDPRKANGIIRMFVSMRPKDAIEASLAVNALSLHILSGRCMRQYSRLITHPSSEQMLKPLCNLVKTEAAIYEQIDRRRRGPSVQKVVVERVDISGGQAVVGLVEGGHENRKGGRTP